MTTSTDPTALTRTIASTATIKLASIASSNLLYTPIEERFERITRLARRALDTPVAAVTVIDEKKQWFKSVSGWAVTELPNERSLCRWALESAATAIIEDTQADPRTRNHPLVVHAPRFRFYAGVPLQDANECVMGTFCVYDVRPRRLTAADRHTLHDLAALVQREMHSDLLTDAQHLLSSKLGIARREAMMDPLTRLWNRRGASTLLKAALENADRKGSTVAVAALDLDSFKRINDTHGHQIGDEVLRRLGSRFIANARANDVVCRIGGDEFLLVMTDTDTSTAAQVAERIRRATTQTPIPTRGGGMPMSISVGFAVRQPMEQLTAEELLERADKALLQSKASGRNRVVAAQ